MQVRVREARPADAAVIARVHVQTWRTAYRALLPAEYLANLSGERREQFWSGLLTSPPPQSCTYVAEHAGAGVVGFANAGPERGGDPLYQSELQAIYVLEEHQGRGSGRQLAAAVARHLLEEGFSSMLVWVLDGNPWRGFYEAMGGEYLRAAEIEVAGSQFRELAYGWRDLSLLASRSARTRGLSAPERPGPARRAR